MENIQASDHIRYLQGLLSEAVRNLETKFPYAEASFSQDTGLSVIVSGKETKVNEMPSRRGMVFTVFDGESTIEYGTSDCTADEAGRIVRLLKDRIDLKPLQYDMLPGDPWVEDFASDYEEDPFLIPLSEKIDHLTNIRSGIIHTGKRVASANVRYNERIAEKIYVNRNKILYQKLLHTVCVPVVIVSDGQATKVLHGGNGHQKGFEVARIPEHELVRLVEDTEKLLEASPVVPGVYDVVGGPHVAGVIAHEAFGHGVEADMFLKQRAKAIEYLDRQVASDLVTLYDSPARKGLSGSYFFDDEGWRSSETCIIENGILRNPLTDHRSSILLGLPRTANGRRESFEKKIYARMSNTYFGSGHQSVEEMIGSIRYGLYMPLGSNGMEDPKNWGIQVESPYAIEIRNGSLTGRVFSPIVMTGFVPDLLKSITMVGPTIGFEGMGICQKGHKEQVRVAIGGPHLKMKVRVG